MRFFSAARMRSSMVASGSFQRAPPARAMNATGFASSSRLRSGLPPLGGIPPSPTQPSAVSVTCPSLIRGADAALSPNFGAFCRPVAWQTEHTSLYTCSAGIAPCARLAANIAIGARIAAERMTGAGTIAPEIKLPSQYIGRSAGIGGAVQHTVLVVVDDGAHRAGEPGLLVPLVDLVAQFPE